jgi:hypothetical protein
MKKIEAYLQPFMLRKVEEALRVIHIHGMTAIDAKRNNLIVCSHRQKRRWQDIYF